MRIMRIAEPSPAVNAGRSQAVEICKDVVVMVVLLVVDWGWACLARRVLRRAIRSLPVCQYIASVFGSGRLIDDLAGPIDQPVELVFSSPIDVFADE